MKVVPFVVASSFSAAALSGCADFFVGPVDGLLVQAPAYSSASVETNPALRTLPRPERKIAAAVYRFEDGTGKFNPELFGADGGAMLAKALQDAGGGQWFVVLERERLENLATDRPVDKARQLYLGLAQVHPKAAFRLLSAMRLDGSITSLDSSIVNGGAGAARLGLDADTPYRQVTATVNLRASDPVKGETLASAIVSSKLYAVAAPGDVYRYVSPDSRLPVRSGHVRTDPEELAVRCAVEKAVYTLVLNGVRHELWAFADKAAQKRLLSEHRKEETGEITRAAGKAAKGGTRTSVSSQTANEAGHKTSATAAGDAMTAAPDGAGASTSRPIPWLSSMQAFGLVD